MHKYKKTPFNVGLSLVEALTSLLESQSILVECLL